MNVKGLPFIDAAYGAYYFIAAIVVSTVLMLVVMRKARWL
jgi:Mg2+ and Co2+ transporter CorA